MHRFFGLLIMTAIGLALCLPLGGGDGEPIGVRGPSLQSAPYSVWAVGLCSGLFLAWLAGLDWRNLPERMGQWVRLQRRRLGWMLVGGFCAGILLLL